MILSVLCRVRHERLSVARWHVADLLRQERESDGASLVWYVCQSPRHARPTEDTTSLQASPSRMQISSLCEDGRAHTIHLYVCKHLGLDVFLLARTNAHLSHVESTRASQALLSPDGMLRIYIGETRIRWPFACLVCVSVTTTRPCTPRTRHHCGHRQHWKLRRRVVGKSGSDIHTAITWMSVRLKGQLL